MFILFCVNIPVVFAGTTPSPEDFDSMIEVIIENVPAGFNIFNFDVENEYIKELARKNGIIPPAQELNSSSGVHWESVIVFVTATIIGYLVINYGMNIFDFVSNFMMPAPRQIVHEITQDQLRTILEQALQDPEAQTLILELYSKIMSD